MKKYLVFLVAGIFILCGFSTADTLDREIYSEKIDKISFANDPIIEENGEYLTVKLEGADQVLMESGKPSLPILRKTFTFSNAAKIKSVNFYFSKVREKKIYDKIIPAPLALPLSYPNSICSEKRIEDEMVYESDELYPINWYDYNIRCGLNDEGFSTTFVTVEIHPIRYSPKQDLLYYLEDAETCILFNDPGENKPSNIDSYDLVIISPETFSEPLTPLINHKNNLGVKTFLKTTEEIYNEYTGRDTPEQIKYFIKDVKENMGVSYVLLVGGLKSYFYARDKDDCNHGSLAWNLPVRYTNIKQGAEVGVISDLYYSDLYRYNEETEEWEFEDWDSNGDGILAKWSFAVGGRDELDLMPDIYIGRLPCRTTFTLNILIDKIINYESTSPNDKPWFKKMIAIAGRTFDIYEGKPDGEYLCDEIFDYMGDLITEPVRVYVSNADNGGLIPTTEGIISAFSQGAGYVAFEGHGNPWSWNTHNIGSGWVGGISLFHFTNFKNDDRLPVVIVGGCHNALYNITIINALLSMYINNDHCYWTHGQWTPICFSWALCIKPNGGAIASTGCTGYGLGPVRASNGNLSNSAALEANFFYQIGQTESTTLGSAHSGAINKYIIENYIGQDQAFCIVEYQLFGDPSLKLGGYS